MDYFPMLTNSRPSCMMSLLCGTWLVICLSLSICDGVLVDQYTLNQSEKLILTTFDIDVDNSKLIIGTTNQLFHLDLELKEVTNMIQYAPSTDSLDLCIYFDGFGRANCQNFHRVVLLVEGSGHINGTGPDQVSYDRNSLVLTCGTNAYYPKCHYRRRTDLVSVIEFSGTKFVPFMPTVAPPVLWINENRLVVATSFDHLSTQFGIAISEEQFRGEVAVQTRVLQKLWFNGAPEFVSMHSIGDYIYFFFREEALSIESRERVIYTRVARVCKNDTGFTLERTQIFHTFVKARISCSAVGNIDEVSVPFHYNEMQDSYYDDLENKLYAVFSGSSHGPRGSALCAYTFGETANDLDGVFSGTFVKEENNVVQITSVPGDFMCYRKKSDAMVYQLVTSIAAPATTNPLFQMNGYIFHKSLSVMPVNDYDIMFITASKKAMDELFLLKLTKPRSALTFTQVQKISLPNNLKTSFVTKMKLYGTGASTYVYIGTENNIYRVPVQSCSDYTTCFSCVQARDPYCGFNKGSLSCTSSVQAVESNTYLQDLENGNATICNDIESTTSQTSTTSGSVSVIDRESTAVPRDEIVEYGLQLSQYMDYTWVIIGVVVGFAMGVILGVLLMLICRCYCLRAKKYRSCGECGEKQSDTITDSSHFPKDDDIRMNNSGSEFTGFSQSSGNDYTSTPDVSKSTAFKVQTSSPPKTKDDECMELDTARVSKYSETPTPTPSPTLPSSSLPLSKSSPPPSSGYRAQGEIFKFDSTCIKMSAPTACKFSSSVNFPSTRKEAGISSQNKKDPNSMASSVSPSRHGLDPNLKISYKQQMHITNQQRESYGRNILARYPSIDGSKRKYIPNGSPRTAGKRTPPPVHPKPSPRAVVLKLDAELGSSQC